MSSKKKILIVAESIDVNDSSGTKGRVALIRNLHEIGYDLRVYHYTRKKHQLDGISCVEIKENRSSILFLLSRIERQMRYKLNLDLHKSLEKLFGFSFTLFNDRNSIIDSLKKINEFDPDLIMTLSKGGSFRPHQALLEFPEWHHKWLAYIHDPYPMHLYPRPYNWVEPGYQHKWKMINSISAKARFSAFPSKLLLDWMSSYFPSFQESGIVIPHQIIKSEYFFEEMPYYFEPGNFNILHAGTLLDFRDPKGLVAGFLIFLQKNPQAKKKARLIFLGKSNLKKKFCFNEDENIYFTGKYVKFQEVLNMQKKASLNIILEAKSEISPFLPGKFPHCVVADRPILLLGPALSESRRLLGEDYPYWAEIDDSEKIAKLLEDLYLKWENSTANLHLNRPDLEDYLGVPHLKNQMKKIFHS